jgi:L-malate glycosyltransferase
MPTVLMLSDAGSIHTVRWANALASRGWTVHLISLRSNREALADGVVLHVAPIPAPIGYLANVSYVRQQIKEIRPELIHAHYASGYGTLGILSRKHPLVLSVWGSDIYAFPKKSPLHAWLIRRNLRDADIILSTSQAMVKQISRFTVRSVAVTPFGIDIDKFSPRLVTSPFAKADIVIGTVKSLDTIYGIRYLVKAFSIVKQRQPRLPLRLLLVGSGPEESTLKKLVARLGLEQDTVFTGRIPHDQVPEYQNMLSISVSVSTEESFGVAVLEASACEKPVIVSAVGGLPEVVDDGVTGLVVPPRDPVSTADAIERLALDGELRTRMGIAGRARVISRYEWQACVHAMEAVYRAAIARNGPIESSCGAS